MLARSVPRFLLEAAFLIAVAVVAALAHLDAIWIVVVMACAFALVVLGEWLTTRSKRRPKEAELHPLASRMVTPVAATASPRPATRSSVPATVRAPSASAPPAARPRPVTRTPVRTAAASTVRTPAPARTVAVSDVPPVPLPPRIAPPPVVPPPKPPPAMQPPPPAPPPAPIAPKIVERRRWNVFDLQNRARGIAGKDAARDEEIMFLLLYLREFADISGDLSEDFDPFVRESFADLIG